MTQQTFIVGGQDVPRHQQVHKSLQDAYKALDLTKRHRIVIEPYVRKRTTNQNSLYWSWMTLIAHETGNDKDEVHEFLLAKFCPTKTVMVGDEEVTRESTKLLSTVEMTTYMDRVLAWAATFHNITLPLPEDQGRG